MSVRSHSAGSSSARCWRSWCGTSSANLWAMPAVAGADPVNLTRAPGSGDGGGAWSPDGRKLLFGSNRDDDGNRTDEDHDLYEMRADGSHQRNVTRDPYFETGPDWQPLPRH